MFNKKTLADIKIPVAKGNESSSMSNLQEKLKTSDQISKVKSLSQPLQTDHLATSKESSIEMIHKTSAQIKPEVGIDFQLEKNLEKEKPPNKEKVNFFIDKHDIVNKKRIDFKVKIRPSKIKEK